MLYISFHNHNYQGGAGKFISKALILHNKQLISNMIDCEATQVLYTRIAFLSDSYILYSNYPVTLYSVAKARYIASNYLYCYMKAALLNKNPK